MALPSHEIQLGEATEHICYTARARWLFERAAGHSLLESKLVQGTSDVELPLAIWAGLEGHRQREEPDRPAWKVDQLIDGPLAELDWDQRHALMTAFRDAWYDAHASVEAKELLSRSEGAEGKAAAEG